MTQREPPPGPSRNTWSEGREVVIRLIHERRLRQVTPSRDLAERMLERAALNAASAESLADTNPGAGLAVGYDGLRWALTALLENQGLRPTSAEGGHAAVGEAIRAQTGGRLGKDFDAFRRLRHQHSYPDLDSSEVTADDVHDVVAATRHEIAATARLLDLFPVFRE